MGRSRNLSLSGALRLDVSPEFSLTLSLAQGWQKPQRYFGMPLINGQPDDALRKKNYNVGDASIDYQDQWAELSALWTPNDTTTVQSRLYHIESKRHWRNAEYYDYLPASGRIKRSSYTDIRHEQTQVGNTTDLQFDTHVLGLPSQVSVGFDVNQSAFKRSNNSPYSGSSIVDLYDFDRGGFLDANTAAPKYRNKAFQYSLFAEDRIGRAHV